jgi:hypothetical protein
METTAPPAATRMTDESGTHELPVPGCRTGLRGGHRAPIHAFARRRST